MFATYDNLKKNGRKSISIIKRVKGYTLLSSTLFPMDLLRELRMPNVPFSMLKIATKYKLHSISVQNPLSKLRYVFFLAVSQPKTINMHPIYNL